MLMQVKVGIYWAEKPIKWSLGFDSLSFVGKRTRKKDGEAKIQFSLLGFQNIDPPLLFARENLSAEYSKDLFLNLYACWSVCLSVSVYIWL